MLAEHEVATTDHHLHFGIDIAAADGTAVYPVESGAASEVHDDWLEVDSGCSDG